MSCVTGDLPFQCAGTASQEGLGVGGDLVEDLEYQPAPGEMEVLW